MRCSRGGEGGAGSTRLRPRIGARSPSRVSTLLNCRHVSAGNGKAARGKLGRLQACNDTEVPLPKTACPDVLSVQTNVQAAARGLEHLAEHDSKLDVSLEDVVRQHRLHESFAVRCVERPGRDDEDLAPSQRAARQHTSPEEAAPLRVRRQDSRAGGQQVIQSRLQDRGVLRAVAGGIGHLHQPRGPVGPEGVGRDGAWMRGIGEQWERAGRLPDHCGRARAGGPRALSGSAAAPRTSSVRSSQRAPS